MDQQLPSNRTTPMQTGEKGRNGWVVIFIFGVIFFIISCYSSFEFGKFVQKFQSDRKLSELKDQITQKDKIITEYISPPSQTISEAPQIMPQNNSVSSGSADVRATVLASCTSNNDEEVFRFSWSDPKAMWVDFSEMDPQFSDYVSRTFSFEKVTKDSQGYFSYVGSTIIGESNNVRYLKPEKTYYVRTWNGEGYSDVASFKTPEACVGYRPRNDVIKNPGAIQMIKSPSCLPTTGTKNTSDFVFSWKNNASSDVRFRISPNMFFSDPSYAKLLTDQPIGETITTSAPVGLTSKHPIEQELVIYPNRNYFVDVATSEGYWGSSNFSFRIKSCNSPVTAE